MSNINGGISPEKFYGKKLPLQKRIDEIVNKQEELDFFKRPKFMRQLLGPSQTWKVFKAQQDAIDCCLQRRNGLMCFSFEDVNARRMFLVAHPKVFWSFNYNRFFKNCNTYEIIQEYSACKLYLDIEYEYAYNLNCNQERMLCNLLKIINFNLNHYFGLKCTKNDILEMDSSSNSKFSRHIIYQIRNVAFHNNYAVGNFIKKICDELRQAYENNVIGDSFKLSELSTKYGLSMPEILELFVLDSKKKMKLLVDEGVYTKNRHFRILGSSKRLKSIPLVPSENNQYKPVKSIDSSECCFFVDSLVTCFSWDVDRVLEFEELEKRKRGKFVTVDRAEKQIGSVDSPIHPEIDSFIKKLISPNGKIRRKIFFSDTSTIVYEIQGYRYCDNIKREHKSNNIKYVVDLQSLQYYQKCYDLDCADFRSPLKPLPDEILFLFEDDSMFMTSENGWDLPDENEFLEILQESKKEVQLELDDDDVTEEELVKVADCTEAIFDVQW